jgi:hypothetical protein
VATELRLSPEVAGLVRAADSSSDEDTSDEAFLARHLPWEQEERQKFLSSGGAAPGLLLFWLFLF